MRCEVCPHLKAIEHALAPCAVCDSGRLHGTVSIDGSPDPNLILSHASPNDHTPQTGVTTLAPEVEDALRIALATIFAFDPVEILLLRHILAGGTYASFNRPLRELADRLAKYDLADDAPGFRSLAQTWAVRMKKTMPSLEDLFKARIKESTKKIPRTPKPYTPFAYNPVQPRTTAYNLCTTFALPILPHHTIATRKPKHAPHP